MSEEDNKSNQNTSTPQPEAQASLFYTDQDNKSVSIKSKGDNNQPDTSVNIEPEIINNTLRYMLIKSAAWRSMHQAYVHLVLLFMNRTWHGENELATKINNNFGIAPFTVEQTKKCLAELGKLGVLKVKKTKGKDKYMISDMGIGMISHDKILTQLLNIAPAPQPDAPSTTAEQQKPQDGETAEPRAAETDKKSSPT